jgi:hypothetical protein
VQRVRILEHSLPVDPVSDGIYRVGYCLWGRKKLRTSRGNTSESPARCWSCKAKCPPGAFGYRPLMKTIQRGIRDSSLLCVKCVEDAMEEIVTTDGDNYEWVRARIYATKGIVMIAYQTAGVGWVGDELIEDYGEDWTTDDVREQVASMLDIIEECAHLIVIERVE